MSLVTLMLIAVGVSADAFAVAVGKGLGMRRLDLRVGAALALAFGAAQGLMPVVGWLIGSQMARLVEEVDHWVAFGLLAAVGGKMMWEARHLDGDDLGTRLTWRELAVLSTATSIDALAVGISFAFLPVSIGPAALLIGVTTAVLSAGGVVLGYHAGARWRRPAEVVGGVILLVIGTRILLDHLGIV